jgi:purine nucleoside phosphorylase
VVGSLEQKIKLRDIVIVDQVIDKTFKRTLSSTISPPFIARRSSLTAAD